MKKVFNRKKIMKLPKDVADRIAAGEVVERPVSIVKELIENSIDSGADSIVLEIKNGGKSYIRVTDNGCGIPADEVTTAFYRHATSKIAQDSDLMRIQTLGFRGEALASISAVTRTQMVTKVPEADTGIRITIEGGNIIEEVPSGAADGTTIIVTDLFYNTPAREKFLKKDSSESSLIIDFISKMTLAYPDIKFRLINNGKVVFVTSGKGDVLENIHSVYGKEIASNLIKLSNESNGIKVEGYISNPVYNRGNRRNQFYFVNGRSVSDKTLEEAISMGYGDKMPEGRFPVAYVFLTLSSELVDVNVHPNKKEVRFSDPFMIRDIVKKSVFECLSSELAVGRMSENTILKANPGILKENKEKKETSGKTYKTDMFTSDESVQEEISKFSFKNIGKDTKKPESVDIINLSETKATDKGFKPKDVIAKGLAGIAGGLSGGSKKQGIKIEDTKPLRDIPVKDDIAKPDAAASDSVAEEQKVDIAEKPAQEKAPEVKKAFTAANKAEAVREPEVQKIQTEKQDAAPVRRNEYSGYGSAGSRTESVKRFDISEIEIMGVVFDTYIAAKDYGNFYLIDQHAAHERVFYEQFRNAFAREESVPQMILAPIIREIPYHIDEEKENWFDFLRKSGFIIESFGGRSYIVRGIPSYMSLSEAEGFLDDYIDSVSESTDFRDIKTLDKIIMRSCKSAVKAHDKLSRDEVEALLKDLSKTENPFSCPHGRPVIIKMGVKEMEKMFKRV